MSIFILSLAGMPPLAGFFGKFYLFRVALDAVANHGLLWLFALALFGSLISLYYYVIVLKVIFSEPALSEAEQGLSPATYHSPLLQQISLSVLAAIVLFLGIIPGPLVSRIIASLP